MSLDQITLEGIVPEAPVDYLKGILTFPCSLQDIYGHRQQTYGSTLRAGRLHDRKTGVRERTEIGLCKPRTCKHSSDVVEKNVVMPPPSISSVANAGLTPRRWRQESSQPWVLSGTEPGLPTGDVAGGAKSVTISLVTRLAVISPFVLFLCSPVPPFLFSSPSISAVTCQYQLGRSGGPCRHVVTHQVPRVHLKAGKWQLSKMHHSMELPSWLSG